MPEYKTPPEITILLRSRDGWTIPEIAEVSLYSCDLLAAQLERWEDISGSAAAEAVKAIRVRSVSPAAQITGMSVADLAAICRIPYQTAFRWAVRIESGRAHRGRIVLSCAQAGEILRRRNRSVGESVRVERWFRAHGLPADCGD